MMGAGLFKDRCDLFAQFFPRLWPQFHNFVPKGNVKNWNIVSQEDEFFNLESGSSSTIKPTVKFIDSDDYELFKQLLGMKFEDLNYMNINKDSRQRLLNHIIDYYSLHLQMFKPPKSIDVFSEIFK